MPTSPFRFNTATLSLDARPDRLDIRDRLYTPRISNLPPCHPPAATISSVFPEYVKAGMILNQGSDGACTGFGLAAIINYLFWLRDPESPQCSPRMLYHLAKFYDEWAGEDYTGSSCRGALKGWHKHGVCRRDLWPYTVNRNDKAPAFEAPREGWAQEALQRPLGVYYRIDKDSVTDMQAALLEIGAIYVSGRVHPGWALEQDNKANAAANFTQLPVIPFDSGPTSGHAYAILGYTDQGFIVQNSWGKDWGHQGFAILTYDDWITYGGDAWAISLGVAIERPAVVHHWHSSNPRAARLTTLPALPAYRSSGSAVRPHAQHATGKAGPPSLSPDQAYGLTLVLGNDGGLIQRLLGAADALAAAEQVVLHAPQAWLANLGSNKKLKLVLYAQAGMDSEAASLQRSAALAPYFLANGIYPLFISWKTGLGSALDNILQDKMQDHAQGINKAAQEALDRTLEAACESSGAKGLWVQMKMNAAQAAEDGDPPRGLYVLAKYLQELRHAIGQDRLEIHLIGHSAGAILHGHLLGLLHQHKLPVNTCSLYAPACSIAFADSTYRPAIRSGLLPRPSFHIHLLSDTREQDDNVGGIYQKSMLYLIARALESQHKTPLLGMAASFDADNFAGKNQQNGQWNHASMRSLQSWNQFYWTRKIPSGFASSGAGLNKKQAATLHIIHDKYMHDGKHSIPSAHTAFDQDVAVLTQTLTRIAGISNPDRLAVPVSDIADVADVK
ncbi:C1 family peptidase [Undibacterium sp. Ji50W]|uniref:C1 family peptidase n=1 Tax=Undibacterium sp. Ji50W TaxID=3413041 RepID=UPI003BF27B47